MGDVLHLSLIHIFETRYPTDIPTEISDATVYRLYKLTEEMFYYVTDEVGLTDGVRTPMKLSTSGISFW